MRNNSTTKTRKTKSVSGAAQTCSNCQSTIDRPNSNSDKTSSESVVPFHAGEQVAVVEAKIDVGLGNSLFIRGEGEGLSWEKGQPLKCIENAKWVWSAQQAKERAVFKLLLNDQIWAQGEDAVVEPGRRVEIVPRF
jgi:hypothetical protein